jgi:hypothetical protein
MFNFTRSIAETEPYDVVVCGAGCAGTLAAIAAAREGARTIVIERNGYAGGYVTAVMGASLDGFVDLRSGRPVVGGLVFDFARAACDAPEDLATLHVSPSIEMREYTETPTWKKLGFDFERFKLAADHMMTSAGCRILYHSFVADAIVRDGRTEGVVVANKGGLHLVRGRIFIDATGDADLAGAVGADVEIAADVQPMSLHFRASCVAQTAEMRRQCAEALHQALAAGEIGAYGGPWMEIVGDGMVNVNAIRLPGLGIDPDALTRAEIQGRRDAEVMFRTFRSKVPGWRDAVLLNTGPCVGVRETRRVVGDTRLTVADIVDRRAQPDVVSLGAWWVDQHPSGSSGYHTHALVRPYDIGLGMLLARSSSNLLVAGRCHSAEQKALASSRVTVTCMGMGEAAGVAAGLAAARRCDIRDVPVRAVQTRLLERGAIILDRADAVRAVGDALPASLDTAVR